MCELCRCERCGSAGSIEFGMCQVCLYDYLREEKLPLFTRTRMPVEGKHGRDKGTLDEGMEKEREMMAAV